MSKINITRSHNQSHEQILETAEELARDISAQFAIRYRWDNDAILFDRPGVSGRIDVRETEIQLQAKLGMLLAAMKAPIENEVRKQLDKLLG